MSRETFILVAVMILAANGLRLQWRVRVLERRPRNEADDLRKARRWHGETTTGASSTLFREGRHREQARGDTQ